MENEERPHDYEAERAILCAVLHDNSAIDDLALKPDDFHGSDNRAIYQTMLVLRESGRGVDAITLYDAMRPQMMASVLAELGAEAFTASHVLDYARIVKETSTKRQMLDQLPALQAKFLNGADPTQLREAWDKAGEALELPEPTAELFTSVGDLLDMEEDKPIAWTVHEMVPRGSLTFIAAEPGAGKSTWLRSMAVSVGQGKDFQGRAVIQGPVLVFSLEESKAMVAEHMRKMGATHEDPIFLRFDPLLDPVCQLRAAIARLQPALVIVDPLPKFVHMDDLNSYGQVSPAMDEIVQLAHEGHGTTILLVTHTNKVGEDRRPGGSIAFSASADVILHLAVEGPERRRVLTGVKNRFDERYLLPPTIIGLDPETGHMTEDGSRDEAVYHEMSTNILAWLAAHDGPQKQKELLKAMGGKSSISHRALTRLEAVGRVEIDRTKKPYVCSIPATVPTVPDSSRDSGTMENQLELPQFPGSPPVGGPGTGEQGNERHEYNSLVPIPREREPWNEGKQKSPASPTVEEQADALLTNDVETHATIEAGWWQTMGPDSTEPPPDGSAAFHAQRLSDLLGERLKGQFATPEALANRTEPYNDKINAVGCLRQWTALKSCGVVIAAEPTVVGYTQTEEETA